MPRLRLTNRRGSVLLMAILVIGLLTILIAGAFTRVSAHGRTSQDDAAKTAAFGVAEAGLERFIAARNTVMATTAAPTGVAETVRINVPGGYADVEMRRVRPATPTTAALYVVRSRGVSTMYAPAGAPHAVHTVSQYAYWFTGKPAAAAIIDLAGLLKNGASGVVTGIDACVGGAGGNKAGVAVPTGMYQGKVTHVVAGSPPLLETGTQAQSVAAVPIDWAAAMAMTTYAPDIVLPGAAWPSFPTGYWPVIKAGTQPTDEFTLPGSGRGLLIVAGNLTIGGGLTWDGLILVGGTLRTNGNNNINGAIVTGLANKLPGYTVPPSDVLNGNLSIVYNSCHVTSAQQKFHRLVALGNAWADSWPES